MSKKKKKPPKRKPDRMKHSDGLVIQQGVLDLVNLASPVKSVALLWLAASVVPHAVCYVAEAVRRGPRKYRQGRTYTRKFFICKRSYVHSKIEEEWPGRWGFLHTTSRRKVKQTLKSNPVDSEVHRHDSGSLVVGLDCSVCWIVLYFTLGLGPIAVTVCARQIAFLYSLGSAYDRQSSRIPSPVSQATPLVQTEGQLRNPRLVGEVRGLVSSKIISQRAPLSH